MVFWAGVTLQHGSPLHRAVTPTLANGWGLALSVAPAPSSTRGAFLLRAVVPPAVPAAGLWVSEPRGVTNRQVEASTGFAITVSKLGPC